MSEEIEMKIREIRQITAQMTKRARASQELSNTVLALAQSVATKASEHQDPDIVHEAMEMVEKARKMSEDELDSSRKILEAAAAAADVVAIVAANTDAAHFELLVTRAREKISMLL